MADEVIGDDEGGESACFAHLICPECGAVLDDTGHTDECTLETLTVIVNAPESNA
jgi:hypothetical protein